MQCEKSPINRYQSREGIGRELMIHIERDIHLVLTFLKKVTMAEDLKQKVKNVLNEALKDETLNEQELNTVEGGTNYFCLNFVEGCACDSADGE